MADTVPLANMLISRGADAPVLGLRALLVDHSEDMREHIAGILSALGFDCVEAGDGIDALKLASNYGIDLIVTDIDMPRLDGLELLSLVQRGAFGTKPPPVIVCANEKDEQIYRTRPELLLCAAQISKPPAIFELAAAVARAFPDP